MASVDNIQEIANSVLADAAQQGQLVETDTEGVSTFDFNGVEIFTSSETNVELPEDGVAIILSGSENLNAAGNENDNFVTGNDGDNTVDAGGGDDQVDAGGGDDTINDGDGNDTVAGGEGNDTFLVGNGDDHFQGNEGDDEFIIQDTEQGNNQFTSLNRGDKLMISDRNGDGNINAEDLQSVDTSENGLIMNFTDGTSVTIEGITSLEELNIEIDEDGGFVTFT
ncbi:MAG: hypothetical protein V3U75_12700 [Methylococcaceae bacterium]